MPDPMTSQSPEPLPCPFCGSKAVVTNVRMSNHSFKIGCYNEFCWRPVTDRYDTERAALEAWNHRRELESRVSPGVAPNPKLAAQLDAVKYLADHFNVQGIEEAERVDRALTLVETLRRAPSSAPEEATFGVTGDPRVDMDDAEFEEQWRKDLERASRSSGEDQPSTPDREVASALLRCAESWEPDACLLGNVRAADIAALCRAVLSWPGSGEDQTAAEEIASLKQQVIDSALRAERLEADRTALIRGEVYCKANWGSHWWGIGGHPPAFATADEALAAYRASLSPQPVPPKPREIITERGLNLPSPEVHQERIDAATDHVQRDPLVEHLHRQTFRCKKGCGDFLYADAEKHLDETGHRLEGVVKPVPPQPAEPPKIDHDSQVVGVTTGMQRGISIVTGTHSERDGMVTISRSEYDAIQATTKAELCAELVVAASENERLREKLRRRASSPAEPERGATDGNL